MGRRGMEGKAASKIAWLLCLSRHATDVGRVHVSLRKCALLSMLICATIRVLSCRGHHRNSSSAFFLRSSRGGYVLAVSEPACATQLTPWWLALDPATRSKRDNGLLASQATAVRLVDSPAVLSTPLLNLNGHCDRHFMRSFFRSHAHPPPLSFLCCGNGHLRRPRKSSRRCTTPA